MNEASEAVLAIVGPTASGKTALSLPLAEALDGEIISMDSRQVYRGMDIGTAKVTPAERSRVPHHGLDLVDPGERYSAGRFARDARGWIREIRGRGRLPMLVGGTGFFLKALLAPVFREPPMDPERRLELQAALDALPREELSRWVERLDPERAALARAGGPQRMVRTLEVALLTGRPLSWWHAHAPPEAAPVPARIVRLVLPRAENVARIDARAQGMFDGGLLAEVDRLLRGGATPDDPGMTGTGYREAADVLLGKDSLEAAVARVQQATRAYARRQETWFRHQLPPGVLELDALLPPAAQVDTVLRWWGTGPPGGEASASKSEPATEVPS
ncbi:MAG: tRNA (adenosine(37)-N6)-dimethylallyltransferase MiaA [Gemmatimonadales bacterium]|nr:MAG: tRNA (adenosine(37)-N6)-dimethylallyltransferase MiaA [Gemmatimonadales bacterium]